MSEVFAAEAQQSTSQPVQIDVKKRVGQAIALRDKIKAMQDKHAEELKPYKEAQAKVEEELMTALKQANVNNMATEVGTVYINTRVSATVKDMGAFWGFVQEHGLYDLVDKRANAPAVTDYINANKHPPPGVNYTTAHVIGVRRK